MNEPIISTGELSYYKLPVNLDQRLDHAIANDDKDEFLRLSKDPGFDQVRDRFKANEIFRSDALNIGIAVLNGETKGIIDLEDVLEDGMTPLHRAALNTSRSLTKYLLERGDDVDVLCDYGGLQVTPIELAVETTALYGSVIAWTPRKSIFELLVYICKRPGLEVIRLLVQNTQNKERVRQAFTDYADKGQLVELTALFLAAPELFLSSYLVSLGGGLSTICMLHLVLNSLEKKTDMEKALSLLLDVFSIVGDKLVAYIRLHPSTLNPGAWELFLDRKELKIAFLLREVARKKLGGSSCDDYFLRFFKPVRPEAHQLASYPRYMPESKKNVHLDGINFLPFYMKRKDISIDYINRRIPNLKPEDAALLNRAIENRLSSMSTLHGLCESAAKISMKGEKHIPQWFPFLSGRKFEPSVPSVPTSATSAKSWFDFKFTPTNNLVNKVMNPTQLKYGFSLVMLSRFTTVAKRLLK